MIHTNITSLCIKDSVGDLVMTSRQPKIVSLLKARNITYEKKTIAEINDLIEGVPGNGYLDYELVEIVNPLTMGKHYHDDLEARVILSGIGTFTIYLDKEELTLQVTTGDYVVFPQGLKHSFKTDGNFSAMRLFTQTEGYVANYID